MPGDLTQPVRVIAQQLSEWETPYVDIAVFGSTDPLTIARTVDDFCRDHLGAGITEYLFCNASIGSVHGVALENGKRVVVKAQQPDKPLDVLREVSRTQSFLAERGLFAPKVLVSPAPFALGHASIEDFIDVGATTDAHRPEIRAALASSLHAITDACRPLVPISQLASHILADLPASQLWAKPHSKLFDFEATSAGADYIDDVARAARQQMVPRGDIVIGHCDWRAEHVRFVDDEPVAAFDWDSLCKVREPFLAGFTAHAFCADWTVQGRAQVPTFDEARAFVADYEQARGRPFDRDERRACGAAFAYSCTYTARCGHALGQDQREEVGTFQHLVAKHGARLIDL
jgi:hypothetical protein